MNKQTAKALWSLSWHRKASAIQITLSESLWSTDHKQQMTCRSLLVSNPLEHETLYCNIKQLHRGQRRQKDLYKLILNRNEQRQSKRATHPVRGVFVMWVSGRTDESKHTCGAGFCWSTSRCCPRSPRPVSTGSSCSWCLQLSPSRCPRSPSYLQHHS